MKVTAVFLSQHTDMPEEMRVETMELCVTACEKFATNNEVSAVCDGQTLLLESW